jgi:hypothetical protein
VPSGAESDPELRPGALPSNVTCFAGLLGLRTDQAEFGGRNGQSCSAQKQLAAIMVDFFGHFCLFSI